MPPKSWLISEAERYERLAREADIQDCSATPASYYRQRAAEMRDAADIAES